MEQMEQMEQMVQKPRGQETFIFYASWYQSIEALENDTEKLVLYRAIAEYGLYHIEPTHLKGVEVALWYAIWPNIESQWKNFINGKKGGAPRGNTNAKKRKTTPLE